MLTLIVQEKGGSPKRIEFDKDEVTVGRVPGNDIVLPKGNVSKRHSRVVRQEGRFFVVDLKSTNGTYLNGRRITTPSVIRPGDKIYIGDFVVVVDMGDQAGAGLAAEEAAEPMDDQGAPPPGMDNGDAGDNYGDDDAEPAPPPAPPQFAPVPAPAPPARAPLVTAPGPGTPLGPRPGPGGQNNNPPPLRPAGTLGPVPPNPPQPAPMPMQASGPAPVPAPPGPLGNRGPGPMPPPSLGGSPSPRAPLGGAPPSLRNNGPGGPAPAPLSGPSPQPPSPREPLAPRPAPLAREPDAPQGYGMRNSPEPMAPPSLGNSPLAPASLDDDDPQRDVMPAFDRQSAAAFDRQPEPQPARLEPRALEPAPMPPPMAPPMAQPHMAAPMPPPMAPPMGQPMAPPMAPPMGQHMAAPMPASIAPVVPLAPAALGMAGPRPAPRPAPEVRSVGEEYPEVLAQVVNAARQRGVEGVDGMADEGARGRIRGAVEQVARGVGPLPAGVTPDRLVRDAVAELAGAGAFEAALEDPTVTTAMVDPRGQMSVGRAGAVAVSPYWFSGAGAVIEAVDRLLRSSGIARDPNQAVVDVSLRDGSRLLAVFPPLTSTPVATLERPAARPGTVADLAERGVLPAAAAMLLGRALAARRNVLVVGARGSGRSTLLGALVGSLPAGERVVVVESRDEVALVRRDAIGLRAEGDGAQALSIALRIPAHRLVLAESTEVMARALVGSLATGTEGMLAAVEGPTGALGLARLAALAAQEPWLSRDAAAARLAATRPLVVETARFGDGQCRVTAIGEARATGAGLQVEPLFTLRVEAGDNGVAAQLVPTGAQPSFN